MWQCTMCGPVDDIDTPYADWKLASMLATSPALHEEVHSPVHHTQGAWDQLCTEGKVHGV